MAINTAYILAGISASGASGADLAWFAPSGATAPTDATTALAGGTNETQTVTITGTPTGGTFTLTFEGDTTAAIAYNATGTTVQTALLAAIGTGNATVTGSAGGPYTVTFTGGLAAQDVPALTATASLTGGSTPGVTIAPGTAGVLGWQSAGLITENGVAKDVKENSKDITAFGLSVPVRKIVTSTQVTMKLTMLETNKVSAAIYNRLALGSITPAAGAFSTTEGTFRSQRYAFVADVVDGSNHIRMYAPSVEVTDRDSLAIKNGEAIEYGVSLTAYPDTSGNAIYTYYVVSGLV